MIRDSSRLRRPVRRHGPAGGAACSALAPNPSGSRAARRHPVGRVATVSRHCRDPQLPADQVGHTLYQASTAPLVLATNRAPSDLDPHSAYDPGSQIALGGLFEGLIQVQTGTADTIDPVLAESWTANADKSVWTFFLRPDVTFQDGTPLDAEAARASFERLLTLGLAPSTVLGRFIDDPARITAPDSRTLVFDLGRPQPLFEAAIAAPGVGAVVNAAALRAHEVDGDWGHGWAQTNSDGIGTGPYRVASFEVEEGVVLERYPEYWRGWAGEHFTASRSGW